MLLILLALVCTAANAGTTNAHTKAYLFDGHTPLEMESTSFYDIRNDANTAEIRYSSLDRRGDLDNPLTLEAAARASPVATDSTFNGIRVFFGGLSVQVTVDGNCETNFITDHGFGFGDLKVFDGSGTLIGPGTSNPPPNDTYFFEGGHVTFNELVVTDDHTISLIGIDLVFDSGERHTWGYTFAALECPTPVDLQSFEVE